jgi:membrane-bound metal-dependent hydrolase YbcI (DUF457 family)
MKFPEHVAFAFLLAQCGVQQEYGPAGTALVVLAGNLPDLDVCTLLGGWRFYRTYHRVLGHGILVTLSGPALLASAGTRAFDLGPLLPLWGWLQVAVWTHLLVDICFYRWPVQLLWPFSRRGWGVGLVAWNDLVPTLLLYGATVMALCRPALAFPAAITGLGVLGLYLGWRALRPRPRSGWAGWLTGNWAEEAAPVWRWLTGDFMP